MISTTTTVNLHTNHRIHPMGAGQTGLIYSSSNREDAWVVKKPRDPDGQSCHKAIEREYNCYMVLADSLPIAKCPYVLRPLGFDRQACALYLPKMRHRDLLQYLKQAEQYETSPTTLERIKWCAQLAYAVNAIHSCGVIHADISIRNVLLDDNLNIKLCDFEGASYPGNFAGYASLNPRLSIKDFWSKEVQDWDEFRQVDIYGLASAMYWILEGRAPFEGVEGYETDEDWARSYERGIFPDTTGLPLGNLILEIWQGKVRDAGDVLHEITAHIPLPSDLA